MNRISWVQMHPTAAVVASKAYSGLKMACASTYLSHGIVGQLYGGPCKARFNSIRTVKHTGDLCPLDQYQRKVL